MARGIRVKEIALHAGVGTATVDRVINGRPGVHPQTRRRVERAIEELEQQEMTIGLSGRKFIVDMVIEAPQHFCRAAKAAMAAELPFLLPAVFRVRHTMEAAMPDEALDAISQRIARLGSSGVIFMGPDTDAARSAIGRLSARGIPVVTLATDLPDSARVAYVGMDNRRCGQAAADLIGRLLPTASASVLVSIRNARFRGEEDREIGFRTMLRHRYPHLAPVEIQEGVGEIATFAGKLAAAMRDHPGIRAVYSIGGNNRLILRAIEDAGLDVPVFLAHDLDDENRALLKAGRIGLVFHHDLRRDMREACRAIMRHHRFLPKLEAPSPSPIQIFTPITVD